MGSAEPRSEENASPDSRVRRAVPDEWLRVRIGQVTVLGPLSRQVGYASYHCGVPVVGELHATNTGNDATLPHRLVLRMPECDSECETAIPPLKAQAEVCLGAPPLRLRGESLREARTATRSRLQVIVDGKEDRAASPDITVLGCRDWGHAARARKTICAFVSPHDFAVGELVRDAALALERATGLASFDSLLASGRPNAEGLVLEYLYRCLAQSRHIRWEKPSVRACFADDPLCQPVRTAGQLLDGPRECTANCLDLAVLMASCLERAGLCPLILFAQTAEGHPQHAFVGCWAGTAPGAAPVINDAGLLRAEAGRGGLLVCECTGVAGTDPTHPKLSFGQATSAAMGEMREAASLCAVDIGASRPPYGAITPMDCALQTEVAHAYDEASRFAREKRRAAVETAFVLYGLLAAGGGLTRMAFRALGLDMEETRLKLRDEVSRGRGSAKPRPTWNCLECQRLAEAYAWHAGAGGVREQDLWRALLDRGSQSRSLQSALRRLQVGADALRSALSHLCPEDGGDDDNPFLRSGPWSATRVD